MASGSTSLDEHDLYLPTDLTNAIESNNNEVIKEHVQVGVEVDSLPQEAQPLLTTVEGDQEAVDELSTSQRAVLALRLLPLERERARARMLSGRTGGKNPHQAVDGGVDEVLGNPHQAVDGGRRGQALDVVARQVGVSRTTVWQAERLQRTAADLLPMVASGGISLSEARRLAALPFGQRQAVLVAVRAGVPLRTALKAQSEAVSHADSAEEALLRRSDRLLEVIGKLPANDRRQLLESLRHRTDEELSRLPVPAAVVNDGIQTPRILDAQLPKLPAVIPYPGGKSPLLRLLVGRIGRRSGEFREPFAGALHVTLDMLRRNLIESAWINDRNPAVAALWTTVIREPDQLISRVEQLEPSIQAFSESKALLLDHYQRGGASQLDLATAKLVAHRLGMSGWGEMGGARITDFARWWNAKSVVAAIKQAHALLAGRVRGNECTCLDFAEVVLQPGDGYLYLDPPYYDQGRDLYRPVFTLADHARLASTLKERPANWLLSYDDCPEVRKLYDWADVWSVKTKYTGVDRIGREVIIEPKLG